MKVAVLNGNRKNKIMPNGVFFYNGQKLYAKTKPIVPFPKRPFRIICFAQSRVSALNV